MSNLTYMLNLSSPYQLPNKNGRLYWELSQKALGKVVLPDKWSYLAEKNAGKNTYLTKFIEKYEN